MGGLGHRPQLGGDTQASYVKGGRGSDAPSSAGLRTYPRRWQSSLSSMGTGLCIDASTPPRMVDPLMVPSHNAGELPARIQTFDVSSRSECVDVCSQAVTPSSDCRTRLSGLPASNASVLVRTLLRQRPFTHAYLLRCLKQPAGARPAWPYAVQLCRSCRPHALDYAGCDNLF
jgi:hypothetical protein